MDPVSIILAALAAGAAAAAKDTVELGIKDAYNGLKSLIKKCFVDKPAAQIALGEYEKDNETWKKPLEKSLIEVGADKEATIIEQAQHLLKCINPQQAAQGKYNVQIGQGQGVVIGDNSTVTQTFNSGQK